MVDFYTIWHQWKQEKILCWELQNFETNCQCILVLNAKNESK